MVWPVGEADMKGQAGAFARWLRVPKRAVPSRSNRARVTILQLLGGRPDFFCVRAVACHFACHRREARNRNLSIDASLARQQ